MGRKGSVQERVIVMLICFGEPILGSTLSIVSGHRRVEYTTATVVWMLGLQLVCGTAALLFLRHRGWTRDDFGFDMTLRSTGGAVLLLFGTNLVTGLLYAVMESAGMLQGWDLDMRFVAAPSIGLLFLIVNSFFEEVFVAGYLIEAGDFADAAFTISVSAIVRLLYHTYQGPGAMATILPMGIIFAMVYRRWRNLWPLVAAHTAMNLLWA